jgi:copper chaperone CopZ
MSCRHCVREVSGWLRDVPGVATVVADARAATVELEGTMTLADVLAVFAGSKYTPQVLWAPQSRDRLTRTPEGDARAGAARTAARRPRAGRP